MTETSMIEAESGAIMPVPGKPARKPKLTLQEKEAARAAKALEKRNRAYRALVEIDMSVFDAALGRIRWLWEEFSGNVHVSVSGGKDSTVVMELAAIVAREHDTRLKVHFLDQEAEWQGTHDYLRELKDTRDDIDFDWYQVPFRLFNSASYENEWGYMWPAERPEGGWLRDPEPDSIRVNDFGKDRFADILHGINAREGGVHLTGMRIEESPTRRLGSTSRQAYKWATWGAGQPDGSSRFYLMHPIYDWSWRDVWKAIEQNGWKYNRLYDQFFQFGVPSRNMRVSSLIHEHALTGLGNVQEIEPETWDSLVRRFPGVNAHKHVGEDIMEEFRYKRPWMFDTWSEYLEYLIDNLIPEEENRAKFRGFKRSAMEQLPWMHEDRINQQMLLMVMRNDHWGSSTFGKWITSQRQWADQWVREGHELKPRSAVFLDAQGKGHWTGSLEEWRAQFNGFDEEERALDA